MKLRQVFSNEYARVEASPEKELIQVTWLEHVSGEPLREVLEVALQYAQAEGLRLWLFDMRRINYTTIADQSWTAKEYFTAFDHRLDHRIACVVNPGKADMLPDSLIQEAIQRHFILTETMEMKVLPSMEAAKDWLSL